MTASPDAPVLVVDAGSSSLRLALVDPARLADAARPGAEEPVIDSAHVAKPPDSDDATAAVEDFLDRHRGARPGRVGYRIVHGGGAVLAPTVADEAVIAAVRAVADLAPLHVPPTLRLLAALRDRIRDAVHVLCPDTAFHAGLPAAASTYALPANWRDRYDLRRYGFHGLSYAWALRRTGHLLGRDPSGLHVVMAHLGGGSSVTAVRDGASVDTSMGLTPLDGVPMSTRSGAVDPGLLLWLLNDDRLTAEELTEGLYRRSGLLGLSRGRSGDTRELVAAAADGDADARLAMDVFTHRVRREIAAAATSLARLDVLVFTGEIGWDQPEVRHDVCAGLALLGVDLPVTGNRDDDGPISAADASIPVLVVQTREELQLAQETLRATS